MQDLILIHGYARTGKTTLENQLKERGYVVYSTSVALDKMVADYLNISILYLNKFVRALQDKDDEFIRQMIDVYYDIYCDSSLNHIQTARDLKIHLAENVFRANDKGAVVRYAFTKMDPIGCKHRPAIATTIGGLEAEYFYHYWQGKVFEVNVRREGELIDCDIRKLSDSGNDFWNDGDIDNLSDNFLKYCRNEFGI